MWVREEGEDGRVGKWGRGRSSQAGHWKGLHRIRVQECAAGAQDGRCPRTGQNTGERWAQRRVRGGCPSEGAGGEAGRRAWLPASNKFCLEPSNLTAPAAGLCSGQQCTPGRVAPPQGQVLRALLDAERPAGSQLSEARARRSAGGRPSVLTLPRAEGSGRAFPRPGNPKRLPSPKSEETS